MFDNVTAKWTFSVQLEVALIKTKSATIAFSSSLSFLLLFLLPFLSLLWFSELLGLTKRAFWRLFSQMATNFVRSSFQKKSVSYHNLHDGCRTLSERCVGHVLRPHCRLKPPYSTWRCKNISLTGENRFRRVAACVESECFKRREWRYFLFWSKNRKQFRQSCTEWNAGARYDKGGICSWTENDKKTSLKRKMKTLRSMFFVETEEWPCTE